MVHKPAIRYVSHQACTNVHAFLSTFVLFVLNSEMELS